MTELRLNSFDRLCRQSAGADGRADSRERSPVTEFEYQRDLAVYARLLQIMSEIKGLCSAWAADGEAAATDDADDHVDDEVNGLSLDAANLRDASIEDIGAQAAAN